MYHIYIYTQIYITTIDNKRGHKFQREQGGLCGKAWSEKREWGNNVLINSKKPNKSSSVWV